MNIFVFYLFCTGGAIYEIGSKNIRCYQFLETNITIAYQYFIILIHIFKFGGRSLMFIHTKLKTKTKNQN